MHNMRPNIKAGTYEFPPNASVAKIIEMLEQGVVVLEQLTVVEGSTFADLRRALENHPEVTQTLKGKTDAEVMAIIGHANELPEGRFFPDTYRFAARTTDADILKLAYDSMARRPGAGVGEAAGRAADLDALRGAHARFDCREGDGACGRASAHCGVFRYATPHGACGCSRTRP